MDGVTRVNPAVSLPLYPSYPAAYPAGRRKGGPGSSRGEAGTGGTARFPTITGGPGSRDYWGSSFPTIATIHNPAFSRTATVPRTGPPRLQNSVGDTLAAVHTPSLLASAQRARPVDEALGGDTGSRPLARPLSDLNSSHLARHVRDRPQGATAVGGRVRFY